MAIFKCKMCGGTIEFEEGASVGVCDSCGTKQTLPTANDEVIVNLHNRANTLRLKCEFDKAEGTYNKILENNPNDAEAHWGIILCKYGIEYVEDAKTYKRVPTCHRTSYDAILASEDYKSAIENADSSQRELFESEAKEIDRIQKDILSIVKNENPFDVFICYKETDENGKRTQDSVIANDIYHQLTQEGLKVFYAAITLEDKLGQEYEPYIFAALNSAKVMLAIGTKEEYFTSVWVKNEWSRFMQLMKIDKSKLLIPCYRDMDAYELPEEFAHLQAQDMSKIGFINDVVRGIKKVTISQDVPKTTLKETVVQSVGNSSANAQIQRGNMALEDHEWEKADEFFEEALNINPQCAEAYLGKMFAQARKTGLESWAKEQIYRYSDSTKVKLFACLEDSTHIKDMVKKYLVDGVFPESDVRKLYSYDLSYESDLACRKDQRIKQEEEINEIKFLSRAKQFATGHTKELIDKTLSDIYAELDKRIELAQEADNKNIERIKKEYQEYLERTDRKVIERSEKAQKQREDQYRAAVDFMNKAKTKEDFRSARASFYDMHSYKDARELSEKCLDEIFRIEREEKAEAERIAEEKRLEEERIAEEKRIVAERLAEEERIADEIMKKKFKKISAIVTTIFCAIIAFLIVLNMVIIPNSKYKEAMSLIDAGDYDSAYSLLEEIGESETILSNKYDRAMSFIASEDYESAYALLEEIGDSETILSNKYDRAMSFIASKDYESACEILNGLSYKDSDEKLIEIKQKYYNNLISKAEVGSKIFFGMYEQDNNTSNGKEDIEWRVLDKEGNRILVISEYVIDSQKYLDTSNSHSTWENCSLRTWLNDSFIKSAFSTEEQSKIVTTTVSADANPKYSVAPGNSTNDKVFLLSILEVERYFTSDEDRVCFSTSYAEEQGAYPSKKFTKGVENNAVWWLRSLGSSLDYSAYCYYEGSIQYEGVVQYNGGLGVRPALWIDLE